eukprot:5595861-Amphidinium_carterae.2
MVSGDLPWQAVYTSEPQGVNEFEKWTVLVLPHNQTMENSRAISRSVSSPHPARSRWVVCCFSFSSACAWGP